MKIKLEEHTIREVFDGYKDSSENGVVAYGGKLNVRPAYQREFVYKNKQRDAVIETIFKGFPLNVIYWVVDEDGQNYEVLDGQQRTISICQYCNGDFSINDRTFNNLTKTEQDQILDYKLMIYICEGNDKEKLDWFRTINIAGEKLTEQELRNITYTGPWLTDAKKYFSKTGCAAYGLASKLLNGETIRQIYLETVLSWISDRDGITIEGYMSKHQHDKNASELWLYFQSVINWVNVNFSHYRKEMKGIEWGILYNKYKNTSLDADELEKEISYLMSDDDVTSKKGIYEYVLDKDEKHLNIRAFTQSQKRTQYEKQNGICPICKLHFSDISMMEGDHITPWSQGGKTELSNLQMLCKDCNRRKSNK